MDLSPKDLRWLRELALGSLIMWAFMALLLLWEWRLRHPKFSWPEKLALKRWCKFKKDRLKKVANSWMKMDRVLLKVALALLISSSGATSLLFLSAGQKELIILLAFICWFLIPLYFLFHLVHRTDKLFLERIERFVAEMRAEGKLET